MGLLDKLQDKGSVLSNINGTQPSKSNLSVSNLQPAVSNLDLDGVTPEKYIDNLPK
jgi:hypothetical protein